jgi:hypothetical protein
MKMTRVGKWFRIVVATSLGVAIAITSLTVLQWFLVLLSGSMQVVQERWPLLGLVSGTFVVIIVLLTAGAVGGAVVELIKAPCRWLIAGMIGATASAYTLIVFDSTHVRQPLHLRVLPFAVIALLIALGTQLGSQWIRTRLGRANLSHPLAGH